MVAELLGKIYTTTADENMFSEPNFRDIFASKCRADRETFIHWFITVAFATVPRNRPSNS